jgi:hypothetical protein
MFKPARLSSFLRREQSHLGENHPRSSLIATEIAALDEHRSAEGVLLTRLKIWAEFRGSGGRQIRWQISRRVAPE